MALNSAAKYTVTHSLFECKSFWDKDNYVFVNYSKDRKLRKKQQVRQFWNLIEGLKEEAQCGEKGSYKKTDTFYKQSNEWHYERDANKHLDK